MSFPRYESYKDSGIEWLGEVPEHWKVKRLKYNLRLLTEKTDRRENPVALENIESWSGHFIQTETIFEGDGISFERGDILFGKLRPYLAKAYLAEALGEAVGDFHVMRPTKNTVGRFAQYQILNREFIAIVDGSTFGAKMPRASWDFMGGMVLTVPPIPEQQTIAAFLDRETAKIDALIAEQQRLIELLKEKRQAVISHVVTRGLNPDAPMKDSGIEWLGDVPEHWEMKRLKDVCLEIVDCKNRTPDEHPDGDYFVVRTSCVKEGKFDPNGGYYTDRANFTEWTRKGMPDKGDILFTREAPTGEACMAPENAQICLGQRMMYLRSHPDWIIPVFLLFSIYSPLVRNQIDAKSKGSTVGHLRVGEVGGLPCLLPSLDEQRIIVCKLEKFCAQFDALAAEAQTAITLLQERRTALISAAVTGKIDVRGLVEAQPEREAAA